jgi:hypothetical protein
MTNLEFSLSSFACVCCLYRYLIRNPRRWTASGLWNGHHRFRCCLVYCRLIDFVYLRLFQFIFLSFSPFNCTSFYLMSQNTPVHPTLHYHHSQYTHPQFCTLHEYKDLSVVGIVLDWEMYLI